jgi:hypothetical protein
MAGTIATKATKDPSVNRAHPRAPEQPLQATASEPMAEMLALQESAGNRAVNAGLRAGKPTPAATVEGMPTIVKSVLQSSGQPLDPATRSYMESRFGEDFSGVRVHTDGKAAESARAVNANAYTVRQDIVFNKGRYAPETIAGKQLLGHELTHAAQQMRNGGLSSSPRGTEHEADQAAARVEAGETATVQLAASGMQCQFDPEELRKRIREAKVGLAFELNTYNPDKPEEVEIVQQKKQQIAEWERQLHETVFAPFAIPAKRPKPIPRTLPARDLSPEREKFPENLGSGGASGAGGQEKEVIRNLGTGGGEGSAGSETIYYRRIINDDRGNEIATEITDNTGNVVAVLDPSNYDDFAANERYRYAQKNPEDKMKFADAMWEQYNRAQGSRWPYPPRPGDWDPVEYMLGKWERQSPETEQTLEGFMYADLGLGAIKTGGTIVSKAAPLARKAVSKAAPLARKASQTARVGAFRAMVGAQDARIAMDVATETRLGVGSLSETSSAMIAESASGAKAGAAASVAEGTAADVAAGSRVRFDFTDSEFDRAFSQLSADKPGVSVRVNKSGDPAQALEIGSGSVATELGLPPDPKLIQVTRTDFPPKRPGVIELNATKPVPPEMQGRFDTIICNNPRKYKPNVNELVKALKPDGSIITQGKGEAFKGMRGANPDFNYVLGEKMPAPPGYEKIIDLSPSSSPGPNQILGGPFYRTTGQPAGWPNGRVIFRRSVKWTRPTGQFWPTGQF